MRRSNLAFLLLFCWLSGLASAQELLGQRFKFTGRWTDNGLEVRRLQSRDPRQDAQSGRVSGTITTVDAASHALTLGPLRIVWDSATRFVNLAADDVAPGQAIEVIGQLEAAGYVQATTIVAMAATDAVELLGTVASAHRHTNGSWYLTVLGVSVIVPKDIDTRALALVRRPDENRPPTQLTLPLFGRPLTVGGELESTVRSRHNFDLDDTVKDDLVRFGQDLQIELFYRPTDNMALFLEAKPSYEATLYDADDGRSVEHLVARGETWVYFNSLFRSNVSVQFGRQNFREPREWWWDEDLDALRVYYDTAALHFELGLAQEVAPESTLESGIPAEQQAILRLPGRVTWEWSRKQLLDVFLLYHYDHSGRPGIGQHVAAIREDESDAELVWLGARLSGRLDFAHLGELMYWLDGAGVLGKETRFDFEDAAGGRGSVVTERQKQAVAGWAVDSGLSWRTRLPWHPTLTLAYSIGSGERTPERGTDHSFRQTGLQDNDIRFRGVNRFQYYGELLRPELSNLHIWTAALGVRFLPSSSLELVYHLYRQVEPAPFLRAARINADPDGEHHAIGQEWDIILGLKEWQRVELEWVHGLFRAGSAYEHLAGKLAYTTILKCTLNF